MSERATTERICPQCGVKTSEPTCPQHGIPTLARVPGGADTVQTGEIIGGRYRVDRLLGKGGFGAVFAATHVVTQQELVLKVLKPNLSEDETQVKRFLQEARTASRLSHPNTVRVYDFGQTDAGHLYLAMELLHGQELGQVLLENAFLPPDRAIHIAIGVLKSLAEAHQAWLVHRDLKPDNIFLCNVHGEDDFVKVIDFGIAKPIDQGDDGGLTRTGFTVGTPKYMSPEQVLNKGVEGRSDLYALGVILYQCLSGELPLSGPSPVETMMAQVQQEPPALSLVCPQLLPPGLEAIVMRALRKQPAQRFVDAEAMRAALEEVQAQAGLATGTRARSAKLRAVTPMELEKTAAHAAATGLPDRPAPALRKPEPTPARATPTTDAGLEATIIDRPARPATQPQPTLKEAPAPPVLDATLELQGPRAPAPVAAPTRTRTVVLPAVIGSVAALAVAGGAWLTLADKPAPVAPSPAPVAAAPPVAPVAPVAVAIAAPAAAPEASPAPLSAADVAAAVADRTAAVAACQPGGAVAIGVALDARGHATDVHVVEPLANPAAVACVLAAVRERPFAAATVPARTTVLHFAAPAGPAPPPAAAPAEAAPAPVAEAPKAAAAKPAHRAAHPAASAKPNGDEAL